MTPKKSRTHLFLAVVLVAAVLSPAAALLAANPTITLTSSSTDWLATSSTPQVTIKLGTGTGTFDFRLRVVGWDGSQVSSVTTSNVAPSWTTTTTVTLAKYGSYTIYGELLTPGTTTVLATATSRLVRPIAVPTLTLAQRNASYIGMDTHWGTHWATLAKCGIHWARDYCFQWLGDGATAPMCSNGVDLGAEWNTAKAAGVTIFPTCQQSFWNTAKNNYRTDVSYMQTAFYRYARAFTDMPIWELDNEANYGFANAGTTWSAYNQAYRGYIHAAAAGLVQAASSSKISLEGDSGIQGDTYNDLLATSGVYTPIVRNDFSVIGYHFYAGINPPETVNRLNTDADVGGSTGWTSSNETLLALLQSVNNTAHAAGKQAFYGEFGYAEVNGRCAVGLKNQTDYLVRSYLLFRSVGCDRCFWYWDRDDTGTSWISHMGLVDQNGVLRPMGAALAALSKFTAISTLTGTGTLGANSWYVTFQQPDGTTLIAAWTASQSLAYDASTAVGVYDIFGNSLPIGTVTLGPDVTYMVYANGAVPTVNAGPDQTVGAGTNMANLAGTVSGEGSPTTAWSMVSGPGTVTFGNVAALQTTATFSAAGTYVLRLTATNGQYQKTDDVTIVYAPGPGIAYNSVDLGGGLKGITFYIANYDGLSMSYAATLAMQGTGGATIQQVKYYGAVVVNSETQATAFDNTGTPVYTKAKDSWVYVPFCDNPIPGISPLDGTTFTGFAENTNLYMLSCGTGSGSLLGNNVNVAYVVATGNVQWTGAVSRNNAQYTTSGVTSLATTARAGDFNGNGYVDQADYTMWADYYGTDGSNFAPGSRGTNSGPINQADYTTWADHYGQGTPPTITISQPSLPAVPPVTGGAAVGDFNGDGKVDQLDYTIWADNQGRIGANLPGDANGDGRVDQADYTAWLDHFGEGVNK